jgi:hypothetical protein
MQRDLSDRMTGLSLPPVDGGRRDSRIATTELNQPGPQAPDPAEIYRRLDRPPRRRPAWITAVAVGVLAIVAAGGVIAYQITLAPRAAPAAAHGLLVTPGR